MPCANGTFFAAGANSKTSKDVCFYAGSNIVLALF